MKLSDEEMHALWLACFIAMDALEKSRQVNPNLAKGYDNIIREMRDIRCRLDWEIDEREEPTP